MRITRVEVEILDVPFREPVVSGAQRWEHHRAGILILRTDDGRKGVAEFPAPRPHDLGEDVSPRLIEVLTGIELSDPVTVEGTLRDIDTWPFVGRAARSAVESALIDLLARVSRQPVAEYLDSQARADVAVNAMLGIGPPDLTATRAASFVEAGFRCLKLKAGAEADGAVAARLDAVRSAVGPDIAIRLDFNGSLGTEQAEAVLTSVRSRSFAAAGLSGSSIDCRMLRDRSSMRAKMSSCTEASTESDLRISPVDDGYPLLLVMVVVLFFR